MQLKLELFEDGLDNYLRGKGQLKQIELQTGKPKGSFKVGDRHPEFKDLFYRCWCRNKEMWAYKAALERDRKRSNSYNKSARGRAVKAKYKKTEKGRTTERRYQNSVKGKKTKAEYVNNNIDRIRAIKLKYARSEKGKEKLELYRKQHPEMVKKSQLKYRKSEKGKANVARYLKTDKAKVKHAYNASKRRARIKKTSANVSSKDVKIIQHFYAYRVRLQNKLGIDFHVDHIVPLSKGGLHRPSNLQVVPAVWNLRKNNNNTERWLPNGL